MSEEFTERTDNRATAGDVRNWARENGLSVGKRGRVSAELKSAFTEATGREVR